MLKTILNFELLFIFISIDLFYFLEFKLILIFRIIRLNLRYQKQKNHLTEEKFHRRE